MGGKMIGLALDRPGLIITLAVALTLLAGAFVPRVRIAPDPADMLAANDSVRLFNERIRREFNLHDTLILGVVNTRDEHGAFNPATLKKILLLSRFAATLHDPKHPRHKVLSREILAPDRVAVMEPAGLGKVRFRWLMQRAPASRDQALAIRDRAMADPLLAGTMISADGRAMAMAIPVSDRDFSHRVFLALQAKIRELGVGGDRFYITGLPLAEARFATELPFQVAALSALALLFAAPPLYLFFRKIALVTVQLAIAAMAVIITMGLLIASGSALQILSTMIPLFIIPVALANTIRFLNGFVIHGQTEDRRGAVQGVMEELAIPMFLTAIVPAACFATLLLAPVPALRIFGLFVALGIIIAWLLTMFLLPAFLMLATDKVIGSPGDAILSHRLRNRFGSRMAISRPWLFTGSGLAMAGLCAIGLLLLRVDGNPLQWFTGDSELRIASRVLNSRLAGTFPAFLILRGDEPGMSPRQAAEWLHGELAPRLIDVPVIRQKVLAELSEAAAESTTSAEMADRLERSWTSEIERLAPDDAVGSDRWSTALDSLDRLRNVEEVFKRPELLRYIAALQRHLQQMPMVGGSISMVDLVKKAHQALMEGDPRYRTVPETVNGVAQAMRIYRNSPDSDRLRQLVNSNYSRLNIRFRLSSGDSRDMARLMEAANSYLAANPPPVRLRHGWAGPSVMYLAWQEKVTGSMPGILLLAVGTALLLLSLYFRSPLPGMMALIPPIFGVAIPLATMGLTGRSYDVPLALLSLLPLAVAMEFGVHFLLQARATMQGSGNRQEAIDTLPEAPAMAHSVIVIAVMFMPLFLGSLRPLRSAAVIQTIGVFWAGLATLWLLPSLLALMPPRFFPPAQPSPAPAKEEPSSS